MSQSPLWHLFTLGNSSWLLSTDFNLQLNHHPAATTSCLVDSGWTVNVVNVNFSLCSWKGICNSPDYHKRIAHICQLDSIQSQSDSGLTINSPKSMWSWQLFACGHKPDPWLQSKDLKDKETAICTKSWKSKYYFPCWECTITVYKE